MGSHARLAGWLAGSEDQCTCSIAMGPVNVRADDEAFSLASRMLDGDDVSGLNYVVREAIAMWEATRRGTIR